MTNEQNWIRLTGVSKYIKKKCILSDINLSFARGKIYGIVGINGSGKTMFLRVIAGLLHLSSGKITYSSQIPSMGIIIENPGFLMNYTGYENLVFLARIRKVIGKEEIRNAMTMVGLNPDDRSKVKTYSLGMKQKLAIAQAIMEKPEMLVLDEPFRGLDEKSISNVRNLLKRYHDCGGTIFLTSHNFDDISLLCDEVYQMQDGKISRMA